MKTTELIEKLSQLRPGDEAPELLRLALLLVLHNPDWDQVNDLERLQERCREVTLQISSCCDQHAAVTEELNSLAANTTCEFQPRHIWMLVRALKIQNQIIDMYLGPAQRSDATT